MRPRRAAERPSRRISRRISAQILNELDGICVPYMPPSESAEIAISDVAAKVGRDRRTNSGRDAATKSATAAVTEVPTEVTSTPMRSVIGPDGVPLPLCRSALRLAIAKRAVGVAATHQVARRYSPRYSPMPLYR